MRSSCSTTASTIRSRRAACVWSNTAALTTARTSIRSSSMPMASACCRSPPWPFSMRRRWTRVSSGVARLDEMLSGEGTIAAARSSSPAPRAPGRRAWPRTFSTRRAAGANAACASSSKSRPQQLLRNMRSIGIDLEPWVAAGLLQFHADRPSRYGLETHLVTMHQAVADFRPTVTVIDPVTNLMTVGTHTDVQAMLTRLIDHLKTENITAMLTSLMPGQTEHRADRDDHLVADGHLDRAGERSSRRSTPQRAARAQVSRHGALERAVRVRADQSRIESARRCRCGAPDTDDVGPGSPEEARHAAV